MPIDKNILSIDSDDEDVDLKSFSKYLQDDTLRQKNKIASEFTELGEDLLSEIEEKNRKKESQKIKFVKYIFKYSDNYTLRQLNSYSFEDVQDIYNEIKNNRNTLRKIFRFIFNL
jgi:hypothetical protein